MWLAPMAVAAVPSNPFAGPNFVRCLARLVALALADPEPHMPGVPVCSAEDRKLFLAAHADAAAGTGSAEATGGMDVEVEGDGEGIYESKVDVTSAPAAAAAAAAAAARHGRDLCGDARRLVYLAAALLPLRGASVEVKKGKLEPAPRHMTMHVLKVRTPRASHVPAAPPP